MRLRTALRSVVGFVAVCGALLAMVSIELAVRARRTGVGAGDDAAGGLERGATAGAGIDGGRLDDYGVRTP
jgi:hypothetical protein